MFLDALPHVSGGRCYLMFLEVLHEGDGPRGVVSLVPVQGVGLQTQRTLQLVYGGANRGEIRIVCLRVANTRQIRIVCLRVP